MSTEIVTLRLNLSLPDDALVWRWMHAMCPADVRGRKQYLSRMVVSALVNVAREQMRLNAGGVSVNFPPLPNGGAVEFAGEADRLPAGHGETGFVAVDGAGVAAESSVGAVDERVSAHGVAAFRGLSDAGGAVETFSVEDIGAASQVSDGVSEKRVMDSALLSGGLAGEADGAVKSFPQSSEDSVETVESSSPVKRRLPRVD